MRRLSVCGAQLPLRTSLSGRCNHVYHRLKHPGLSSRCLSSRPQCYEEKKDPQVDVRFFEQATLKSKDRKRIDYVNQGKDEEEKVLEQIQRLREELDVIKKGPFAPGSSFMQSLPEKERSVIEQIVAKYEAEHPESQPDDTQRLNEAFDEFVNDARRDIVQRQVDVWKPESELEEKKEPPPLKPYEVNVDIQDIHRAYVSEFNKSLQALHKESTPLTRREAMRYYRRCKGLVPGFLSFLPNEALELLWKSMMNARGEEHRAARGSVLAEDILNNGKHFSQSQWIDYLELLHENGKSEQALGHWRSRQGFLDFRDNVECNRFWHVGLKLLIANNELAEARAIAFKVISKTLSENPKGKEIVRILIPVIIGYAKSTLPQSAEWAWLLYVRVRQTLAEKITMEDYDTLSIGFLRAGRGNEALAVFKDMMVTYKRKECDSVKLYTASIGPLKGVEDLGSITAADLNKVNLGALTVLPKSLVNKFFFASWIKKLIGMNEVDCAASVVELMFERDVKPDAKHLNGLIGAWLRTGSSKHRIKAETLGWSMIQKRIDRALPPQGRQVAGGVDAKLLEQNPFPEHLRRTMPDANIETFCVLLLHYSRRQDENMVNYLLHCLSKSRVQPNTFLTNHLLYAELRKGDVASVWNRYQDSIQFSTPDLETFACLWDCAANQLDRKRRSFCHDFPKVRELYKMMMDWYNNLPGYKKREAQSQFSEELYSQILRCFSFSVDPRGAVVALYSLKHTFDFAPDSEVALIIISALTRLAQVKTVPGGGRTRSRASRTIQRNDRRLEQVGYLMEYLRDTKIAALGKEGMSLEDLTPEERRNLQLEILADSLRIFLNRLSGHYNSTEAEIRQAAEQMGVSCDVGKPVTDIS